MSHRVSGKSSREEEKGGGEPEEVRGPSDLDMKPSDRIEPARSGVRSVGSDSAVRRVDLKELEEMSTRRAPATATAASESSARMPRVGSGIGDESMMVEVPVTHKAKRVLGFQAPAKALLLLGEDTAALADQERRLLEASDPAAVANRRRK